MNINKVLFLYLSKIIVFRVEKLRPTQSIKAKSAKLIRLSIKQLANKLTSIKVAQSSIKSNANNHLR